jgi:5-methylcytosine-specific restriction endonuclease McrA
MADTLVLDMNWEPVGFCSWRKAVKLWYEDRAVIIKEDETGKVLRSPSFELGMPRVIRVRNAWVKRKRLAVPCTRRNVLVRDNATCQYCGKAVKTNEFTIDHVLPLCQGGKTEWLNVAVSCVRCNKQKGGRTPEQAGMPLLKQPNVPKVNDPRFNFKLRIHKVRNEWKDYAAYLYWNVALDPE